MTRIMGITACSVVLWVSAAGRALAADPPTVNATVNGASFTAGAPVAAGSVASVFGSNLASAAAAASAVPLPTLLGDARVSLNGIAAPLFYVSPGQINFQVPWELAGPSEASLTVTVGGMASAAQTVKLAPAAPGIFTTNGTQGAITISSSDDVAAPVGSILNHTARPARRGEFITIYCTGLGSVTNQPKTGAGALGDVLSVVTTSPTVTIGGATATVTFAGLTPPGPGARRTVDGDVLGEFVGLYQINVLVPMTVPISNTVPVAVTSGGMASNSVNLAVQGESGTTTLTRWVQMGTAGAVIARAITSESSCPNITFGSQSQAMQVRARPSLPAYPVLSCEAVIPPGTVSASIDGQPLPLPKANPQRILVIGDTGCRQRGTDHQACNDPNEWPFPRVAGSAAAWRPDVIVHVGDYFYREEPCPVGFTGCVNTPTGYNWDSWNADFFTPANPALAAAPWVFVRGNHEDCNRAWEGFFRFLDPHPFAAMCPPYTDPVSISIGAVQLFVMDDSAANDTVGDLAQADQYAPQFDMLRRAAGPNTWLLMHRPLWGIGAVQGLPATTVSNATMQFASRNNLPSGVALVLSGHGHFFEALNFIPERAPQLVVGNSGALLYPLPSVRPGASVGGAMVSSGTTFSTFGFTTFEPATSGWTATPRDVNGLPQMVCSVANRAITCNR
ncbi:MAG: metallophosphoesterase [Acidobacteria bacterium]|nr:metallophosphoesterase [Acidobacteriota bacterium]